MNLISGKLVALQYGLAPVHHYATGEQFVPTYAVHTLCGRTLTRARQPFQYAAAKVRRCKTCQRRATAQKLTWPS